MDIHIGGELVESLSEEEPDTPVQDEAPPTSVEDVPDAGKQTCTLITAPERLIPVFGYLYRLLKQYLL